MPPYPPSSVSRDPETGSTVIEALMALLLIALALGAAFASVSGGLRSIGSSGGTIKNAATLLRFDDALRNAALDVRVPYWEGDSAVTPDGAGGAVGFWQGTRNEALRLGMDGNGAFLENPSGRRNFPKVELLSVGPLADSSGRERGLRVSYRIGEREFSTEALFGAAGIGAP